MSEHKITIGGRATVRLQTAGKYCDRDIVITAEGVDLPELSNPGTAEDLMAGKELLDGEGKIVTGAFSLEPELSTQDALIEQIKTALQNKAVAPDVKDYEGKYDVTPAFDAQVLETKDKYLRDDVQINAIPIIRVSNTSGGTTVFIATEV